MSLARAARELATLAPSSADVLANLPTPVIVVDAAGRVARANAAAEEWLGVSEAGLRARGLPPPLVELARRAGDAGVRAHDLALTVGDEARVADVAVEPFARGWLALTIAPRPPAPRAAEPRPAAGLAALLAHEIKNPLAGIRGAAQLLGATADADGRELTDLIRDEVDRVVRLVDRLESLSNAPPIARAPLNLHEVLAHVRRLARGLAPAANLRETYDPSLPPIAGDRDALVQLFLNLIKNAVEAAGPTGNIEITTAFRHGARAAGRALPIEVRVIDDGPGAPPGIAHRLFEPFVSTKPLGGGLGLALVAKIAAEHDAVVDYARQAGRTVLRVRFAAARP